MAPRRLLGLLVVAGLALAGIVLPAAAQTSVPPPSITISPTSDAAGTSGTWSITVTGRDWAGQRPLTIQFADDRPVSFTPSAPNWSRTITPARRFAGNYQVLVRQDICGDGCIREATAQFRAVPQLSLTPSCSRPGTTETLTVNGANWAPQSQVTVTYDEPSNTTQVATVGADGSFSTPFTVTPPDRDVVVAAQQGRSNQPVRAVWPPCPPPGVTTTTSTTAPPVDIVPTTTPDPTPDPTTTTVRTEGFTPETPPVTLPPTIELPPATPGATLALTPEVGPPGFVTGVTGTGFPPGPVVLAWLPGIGTTTTVAGPDGTIATRVLIFPGDRLGPRALVATGSGGVTAVDAFLVVPATVQPSGQEVSQINRIRRFNNR